MIRFFWYFQMTDLIGAALVKRGRPQLVRRPFDSEAVVPGLMAVGEAACVSVHGANRLGTNSLLDLFVSGRAAAERAAEIVEPGAPHSVFPFSATEPALARFDRVRHANGRLKTGEIRVAMQRTMQDHCSVFRTARVLEEGLREMTAVTDTLSDLAVADHSLIWNTDLVEALELDNLLGQAAVILHSALYRTESRGAPGREDYRERDDRHSLQ